MYLDIILLIAFALIAYGINILSLFRGPREKIDRSLNEGVCLRPN